MKEEINSSWIKGYVSGCAVSNNVDDKDSAYFMNINQFDYMIDKINYVMDNA